MITRLIAGGLLAVAGLAVLASGLSSGNGLFTVCGAVCALSGVAIAVGPRS